METTLLNNEISISYKEFKKILNYDKENKTISGDYGVTGNKTFCEKVDNKLFIANGIGGLTTRYLYKDFL